MRRARKGEARVSRHRNLMDDVVGGAESPRSERAPGGYGDILESRKVTRLDHAGRLERRAEVRREMRAVRCGRAQSTEIETHPT